MKIFGKRDDKNPDGGDPIIRDASLDGPEHSPDLLAAPPIRGAGVRRLNKKPLLIAGAAGLMTIGVLGYSMHLRAEAQRAPADDQAKPQQEAKQKENLTDMPPEVLEDAPEAGVVPEAGYLQASYDPAGQEGAGAYGSGQVPALVAAPPGGEYQTATAQPAPSRYEEEWRQYDQARAAIRQERFDRTNAALASEMKVSTGPDARASGEAKPASAENAFAAALAQLTGAQSSAAAPSTPIQKPAASSALPPYYSTARLAAPVSSMELKAGTVIPAVLIGGVNSELPGQIVGQVSRNVYDSTTGRYLLIPQGSKVVGEYDSDVQYGQARVQVAWKRLILPDGSSFDLGKTPGVDRQGYAGLRDKVNNHYVRAYGSAFMVSLFSAGIQLSQPQATNGENISASQTTAAAIGQQMGQLGAEQARRNLNIKPELQIRPGFRLNISVTEDLILREWRPKRS